jgi:hypothetical protein
MDRRVRNPAGGNDFFPSAIDLRAIFYYYVYMAAGKTVFSERMG